MIFTQEQIEELKKRLFHYGIKDSQLPLTKFPLRPEDTIAIVQDGENRNLPISHFIDELDKFIGIEPMDNSTIDSVTRIN